MYSTPTVVPFLCFSFLFFRKHRALLPRRDKRDLRHCATMRTPPPLKAARGVVKGCTRFGTRVAQPPISLLWTVCKLCTRGHRPERAASQQFDNSDKSLPSILRVEQWRRIRGPRRSFRSTLFLFVLFLCCHAAQYQYIYAVLGMGFGAATSGCQPCCLLSLTAKRTALR